MMFYLSYIIKYILWVPLGGMCAICHDAFIVGEQWRMVLRVIITEYNSPWVLFACAYLACLVMVALCYRCYNAHYNWFSWI